MNSTEKILQLKAKLDEAEGNLETLGANALERFRQLEAEKAELCEERDELKETLSRFRTIIENAGFQNIHEILKELRIRTEERDELAKRSQP